MYIGVLGINHKSGPFGVREKLAKAVTNRLLGDAKLVERFSLVILNTCSRTELYFSDDDLAMAQNVLLSTLREAMDEPFEHALYTYFGVECFSHLAKVTAGLDSTILFETEIQRQVKVAYSVTACQSSIRPEMHFLFQRSLKLGKEVRSQLPTPGKTFPSLINEVIVHLLGSWKGLRVLFVGNSEINRQVIDKLKKIKTAFLSICTRSPHAVMDSTLDVLPWSQLEVWPRYDVVVTGTNSASYLIRPSKQIMRTKVLIDLGVPRNADPRLGAHPQLIFFHLEQLSKLLEKKQHEYQTCVENAVQMIEEKITQYVLKKYLQMVSTREQESFQEDCKGCDEAHIGVEM